MSTEIEVSPDQERRRGLGWRKIPLVLSIVLTIVGLGLMGYAAVFGGDDAQGAATTGAAAPSGALGFSGIPGQSGDPEAVATGDPLGEWSPMIFRLGFSFFVGFCIAYALRTFMKVSIIAIGILLLALFGLQYAGVLDINWEAISGHYDTSMGWLREQTTSFTAFVQGYLPSSASGGLGFVAGFKKR